MKLQHQCWSKFVQDFRGRVLSGRGWGRCFVKRWRHDTLYSPTLVELSRSMEMFQLHQVGQGSRGYKGKCLFGCDSVKADTP